MMKPKSKWMRYYELVFGGFQGVHIGCIDKEPDTLRDLLRHAKITEHGVRVHPPTWLPWEEGCVNDVCPICGIKGDIE